MAVMRLGRPLRRSSAPPGWIEISGFKALREPVRIRLRPLTLFAGANSSGKSSVMQPLLMMKQTLEAAYDPGALLLDGPHVRFTQPDQFLSRGKRRDDLAEAVSVTFGPLADALRRPSANGRVVRGPSPPVRFTFKPSSTRKLDYGLAPAEVAQKAAEDWVTLRDGMTTSSFIRALAEWDPERAEALKEATGGVQIRCTTDRFSVRALAQVESGDRMPHRFWIEPVDVHLMWLLSMLHLPGLRGHRERRYEAARVGYEKSVIQVPGPFTPYVASMIIGWQDDRDRRLEQVNQNLKELGLTWKVTAGRVSAAEVELKVGRTPEAQQGGANDLVDIADVGFGVSQVLPVVVALAAARKGQLVYIEQPELHLHPRAQHKMGVLLAHAAARGVRVVVETHSKMVLRAIQTAVAAPGGLKPSDVGLHWFDRDPGTGVSRVRLADLDKTGAFGDWPIDFSEVESDVDEGWIELAFGASGA